MTNVRKAEVPRQDRIPRSLPLIGLITLLGLFGVARGQEQYSSTKNEVGPPVNIVIETGEDGMLRYVKEDFPFPLQMFRFDPNKKQTKLASDFLPIFMDRVPVPVHFNSTTGAFSPVYANTILEFKDKDIHKLPIGVLYLVTGEPISGISIVIGNYQSVLISSDYLVFPKTDRTIDANGPFVTLIFFRESAEASKPIGGRIVVKRNGKAISESPREAGEDFNIELQGVKNNDDYIEWFVEDQKGQITHRGGVSFPVTAGKKGLVSYSVFMTPVSSK